MKATDRPVQGEYFTIADTQQERQIADVLGSSADVPQGWVVEFASHDKPPAGRCVRRAIIRRADNTWERVR